MEPHKPPFFDQKAAVDDLTKSHFCNKMLIDKMLFEINKDSQTTPKPPQNVLKSGRKKNFHFANFAVKKCKK